MPLDLKKDCVALIDGRNHGKNWYIQLFSDDVDLIQQFKSICYLHLPRESHWFHQGSHHNWQMFEFWTDDQDIILCAAIQVAEIMKLPVEM